MLLCKTIWCIKIIISRQLIVKFYKLFYNALRLVNFSGLPFALTIGLLGSAANLVNLTPVFLMYLTSLPKWACVALWSSSLYGPTLYLPEACLLPNSRFFLISKCSLRLKRLKWPYILGAVSRLLFVVQLCSNIMDVKITRQCFRDGQTIKVWIGAF